MEQNITNENFNNGGVPQDPPLNQTQNTETSIQPSTSPTSPVVPPAPTKTTSANQSSSPRSGSKIFLVIAVIILLVAGGIYLLTKTLKFGGTGSAPTLLQKVVSTDLSRYEIDTDSDVYPDFIETELGLDPNISEYDACKKDSCADAQLQQTGVIQRNVLIILDSSGSMGLKVGNETRMEAAKKAIKNYVVKSDGKISMGLMIYGHKGSNSESDKSISCGSAETIAPIGSLSAATVDSYLEQIQPVGWTPTGLAIRQSTLAFSGRETQKNEVIVLSDGIETCDSNPVGAAQEIKASGVAATVNVIGFAVDNAAQSQLTQVSSAGGGIYSSANNAEELDSKFNDLYENGLKVLEETQCKTKEVEEFRACYNAAHDKVYDWLSKRKLLLYEKQITQAEYDRLEKLNTDIWDRQKEVTYGETQKTINELQQKSENVFGQ